MRRILVTGAAGFVGRHLLAALAAGDPPSEQILGIGRGRFDGLPAGVAFRQIDLLDADAVSACLAAYRPTDVLHLAGLASVQQASDAPTQLWRANVVGLLNLAEAVARSAPGANFVFASSGEVYGRAFLAGGALGEEVEPQPLGNYARSKWFGEQILADVLPKAGVRLVILRLFNHVGPGQDERFVVASFAGQIARIEAGLAPPVLEVGNLDARRDFLPVRDVVRAYVAVLDHVARVPDSAVLNVGSGLPRSIDSILSDLTGLARAPFTVRVAPDRVRPAEIPVAAGDAARLRAAVGWTPTQDWHAALAEILDDARVRVSRRAEPAA